MLRLNKDTKDDLSLAVEEIDSLLKDIEETKEQLSRSLKNGDQFVEVLDIIDRGVHFTEKMNKIKQILIDNQD